MTLEQLWRAAGPPGPPFRAADVARLPEIARRHLRQAIGDGAPAASPVRLRMHGEIRLRGAWHPFRAEEVIRWPRGFIWRARAKLNGLAVVGSDRWIDGAGSMRWKLLGLIPVMTGAGPDISRAALGRAQIESIWLPSVLARPDVAWQALDASHATATVTLGGGSTPLRLAIDPAGRLRSVAIERWGNPHGGAFGLAPFGALVEDEATFGRYTLPSKLRIGWQLAGDRFERDGESFRVTLDDAELR